MKKNILIISLIFIIPIVAYFVLTNSSKTTATTEETGKPQVIKFTSAMCLDCQTMNELFKEIWPNYQDKIVLTEIQEFELVNCPEDIKDKNVLIVDDLCSKGGTFIASAELIKKAGAKRVCLYVSHCEDAIFNGKILKTDFVDMVYTTNSINRSGLSKKIYEFCI